MDQALTSLLAASIAFVGSHFALSHPLRAPLVRALGEKGFLGVYSMVSLAAFAWMVMAFRAAPVDGPGRGETGGWIDASLLTIVALVLLLGSLRGNPALPDPTGQVRIPATARGVFRVTRHPMMWGIALWALAHILQFWSTRTLILGTAILVLALLGAHLQDRKKEALLGAAWREWEKKTHYWPRWQHLFSAGPAIWLGAILVWLAATWAHLWLAGIPAGVWRWVG
jgi:uncharacterized membrane protein